MPKTFPGLILLAIFAAATTALYADTYNYSISAGAANNDPAYNFNASGSFSGSVDPYDNAGLDLTGITGSANGYDFLGVVAPGITDSRTPITQFGFAFDNVVYPSSAEHVDDVGFCFISAVRSAPVSPTFTTPGSHRRTRQDMSST